MAKVAWICKLCTKPISRQSIPLTLENQLYAGWKEQLINQTVAQRGDLDKVSGGKRNGASKAGPPKCSNEMITILRREWDEMVESVQRLSSKQNVLLEQYEEVCSALKRTQERVEVLKNERVVKNATQIRRINNKTTDQFKGGAAKPETSPPGRPTIARVEVPQACPIAAMGKAPQTTCEGTEGDNSPGCIEKKPKLNWAQITILNIPDINNIIPTQLQRKINKPKTNINSETFQASF